MKISGIICEYNPFHNGHAYLLEKAKAMGDAVVCVMSGHFVQRGDVAVADRYLRAKAAIFCGADLVLELPVPFSFASAPYFASAGVEILDMIGADSIVFGSESGELGRLSELAERSLSPEFAEALAGRSPEKGAAAAYYEALGTKELLSNDILALEYLRAMRRLGSGMRAVPVTRVGDGFGDTEIVHSRYASATALRALMAKGNTAMLGEYMPTASRELFQEASPASLTRTERGILSFFRLCEPESLSGIAGLGGGLGNRLCECAMRATSLEELLGLTATKKYTDGAIRRAILAAMLGVTYDDLDGGVAYTTVLGADAVGRELLGQLRRQALPILTKNADIEALFEKCPERAVRIRRAAALSARADSFFALCLPQVREAGAFMRMSPFMG